MQIKIDVYFKNKENNKFHILHDIFTEDDLTEIIKEKFKDDLPMWMNENWEFNDISIDEIKL